MISKSIYFNIDKCDNKNRVGKKQCNSNINGFVKDISVDTWVMQRKMNFTDKIGEPSFILSDIVDSVLLNP